MSNIKTDKRIRKTRKQIRLALTQLLKEKELKEITVSELTELADINRGTFYLHYRDIYDLFEKVQSEVFDEFKRLVKKHSFKENASSSSFRSVVMEAFEFIAENSDFCSIILNRGDLTFLNNVIELGRESTVNDWCALYGSKYREHFNYYYSFMTSGCAGLLRHWMENGMKMPPSQLAAFSERIMLSGVKMIGTQSTGKQWAN
ncbi:MAG: DNA-binding transcriptional repressor FabR [Firmicutes bacterium ADurb.Bin182]|nr:MAG: DNA-binding transcriptional repressor FabR [Firmicutes bacterium ADurb.Bin182]